MRTQFCGKHSERGKKEGQQIREKIEDNLRSSGSGMGSTQPREDN
jgi:hypothetical protein